MARLFVGNLPFSAAEADIQSFFADAGFPVDSVDLMRDKFSGEARGFAFVEIADQGTAQRAVEACNGKPLLGRNLVVNEARPMSREGGGGGGGRQRDFGGSPNRW